MMSLSADEYKKFLATDATINIWIHSIIHYGQHQKPLHYFPDQLSCLLFYVPLSLLRYFSP